jgi:hypothetical protein
LVSSILSVAVCATGWRLADVRFAFGVWVTLVVVLTLGVAIRASTAIFFVCVLLPPLEYPDEGAIVRVAVTVHESNRACGASSSPSTTAGC